MTATCSGKQCPPDWHSSDLRENNSHGFDADFGLAQLCLLGRVELKGVVDSTVAVLAAIATLRPGNVIGAIGQGLVDLEGATVGAITPIGH